VNLGAAAWVFVAALVVSAPSAGSTPRFELRLKSRIVTPSPGFAAADSLLATRPNVASHLLVQLRDPESAADRRSLEAEGVRFFHHLPENTWFVAVSPQVFARPNVRERLRWAGPVQPGDRLQPRLRSFAPHPWAIEADGRWRLQVRFFGDVEAERARVLLRSLGASITSEIPFLRAFEITAPAGVVSILADEDSVFWIRETSPPRAEANDQNRMQCRAGLLHAPPYSLAGADVVAAVWDAGSIDPSHPDFVGRLVVADGASPHQHATHVGGTMAGSGANSIAQGGTALQWRGMAPAATIVSYDWDNPIAEHDPAINTYGASISQNSWTYVVATGAGNCEIYGDYDYDAPAYDEIISGIVGGPMVVGFAAGNERDDGDCGMVGWDNYANIPPPSTSKNMLTVGAINANDGSMTGFSSWGPVDDGRIKPEIVAGGCQSNGDFGVTSTFVGGGYGVFCGTSMATPTVSGCVALLQEDHERLVGTLAPVSLVRALLLNTAIDRGPLGPDYQNGFGQLDIKAAVDQLRAGAFANDEVATSVEEKVFPFYVEPGRLRVQVTLCWTDPPAAPASLTTLVNDLDLVLVGPDATEHEPWLLTPGMPQLPAVRGTNHRDVVEQVSVVNPLQGTWLAKVRATTLPDGPQAFSLAGTTPEPPCAGVRLDVPGTYSSVQAAIDAASFCDTVVVAPGVYDEHLMVGEKIVLRSSGGPSVTTLRGLPFQRVIDVTADAFVEGFTIEGGLALGAFPSGFGGGLYAANASPVVRDCRFRACTAQALGGGASAFGGSPRFESCTFEGNASGGDGGALGFEETANATVTRCVIYDGDAGASGGGVAVRSGSATLSQNTIAVNHADSSGGAIATSSVTLVLISNNILFENTAPVDGAIACSGSVVTTCNDLWANGSASGACASGSDDFAADPSFCDAAARDFRIDLSSPCAPSGSPGACGLIGAMDPVEDCAVVGVRPPGSDIAARFSVRAVEPNPSRGSLRIRFVAGEPGVIELALIDVAGRFVHERSVRVEASGPGQLDWNFASEVGRHVPPGVYYCRVGNGTDGVTRRFVLIP
jgi:hypothetical protein